MQVATTATAPEVLDSRQRGDARAVAVAHRPGAVPVARRTITADVAERVDDELVHEVSVVVSELLGNALRHARPDDSGRVLLRWQVRGDVVDVEVTDGGSPGEVRPQRPAPMATSGRGLRIVRALAHEWGVVEEDDGRRTVWAALGGPTRRRRPVA
ncbi:ATP-binding protein [Pseudokineococcus marinus]|uniref:ATP-binding protein n=1 Tax=Pseudokineococcus marinus TaxID=351215 RepID=A0A849BP08_9ACTN|nr:ATP-binding protein [Pseudokineococcus marinus]